MSLRFASLGSGSRGNATLVEADGTLVMVDCGFAVREVERRMARLGCTPAQLSAILVTHEHSDHLSGVARLARRYRLPVYATPGTARRLSGESQLSWIPLCSHSPLALDGLAVSPFPVPHDASEPVQFVFSDGAVRLGLLTDVGESTPHIRRMLAGCQGLILEANHDAGLLASGPYPASLKRRVAGPLGHLSNAQAAALLAELDTGALRCLVAAHLSDRNNAPALALAALAGALDCSPDWIQLAAQETGLDWQTLG